MFCAKVLLRHSQTVILLRHTPRPSSYSETPQKTDSPLSCENRNNHTTITLKMGYDNGECIFCYGYHSSNNLCENTENVCGHCVEKLLSRHKTNRFIHGLVEYLEDGFHTNQTRCFLCFRSKDLIFFSPCCENHKGSFHNEDEDTYSDSDGYEYEATSSYCLVSNLIKSAVQL